MREDLPSLYGIQNVQELNSLFTALAYNTAGEVSLEELSQESGIAKNTIKRYITYLESAFLLRVVHRIDRNATRLKKAMKFKVYLTNPCMRSALFASLQPDDEGFGHLVETGIFAQWFHNVAVDLHYARWKEGEVDIVHTLMDGSPQWAVEVKWSDRYVEHVNELKSLRKFLSIHKRCKASVTTRTKESVQTLEGREVRMLPASLYAYELGRNIIESARLADSE